MTERNTEYGLKRYPQKSVKLAVLAVLTVIAANTGNHGVQAASGEGLTIGDVANMAPHERIKYIHNEASRRGLELGVRYGDAVLNCLEKEFVDIKPEGNGNHIVPRGLKAAIRDIHLANNNGYKNAPAAERISGMVDLVAARVCKVEQLAIK